MSVVVKDSLFVLCDKKKKKKEEKQLANDVTDYTVSLYNDTAQDI